MTGWRGTRIAILVVALFAAAFALTGMAHANGKPVTVTLSYVGGVSNWGPTDAHGVAVVAVSDGEVMAEIDGLPALTADTYHLWLVRSEGGAYFDAGEITVGASGHASFREILEDLPSEMYSMVVISVEPKDDRDANPDARRSIVGYVPYRKTSPLPTPLATPTPLAPAAAVAPSSTVGPMSDTGADVPVAYLPATGTNDRSAAGWGSSIAIVVGSIGSSIGLRNCRSRKRSSRIDEVLR
jgi:hypothetical protein